MTDAALDLQKAIYARLSADADIGALIGAPARLYDIAPDNPHHPFAVFSEWREAALSGRDAARVHTFSLRVFTRHEGRAETRKVLGAIYDALQDANLVLPAHRLVSLRFVFSDVFLSNDGRTWNGVTRFRAVTDTLT